MSAGEEPAAMRARIERTLGTLPPHFEPALARPAILEGLWADTRNVQLESPLPPEAVEAILVRLAVTWRERYMILRHVHGLAACSVSPAAILSLLERPAERGPEALARLRPGAGEQLVPGTPGGDTLVDVAVEAAGLGPEARAARGELARALGPERRDAVVRLIEFAERLRAWLESHPALPWTRDAAEHRRLGDLVAAEPRIGDALRRLGAALPERREGVANGRDPAEDARLARAEALAGIGSWEWDVAADRVTWSAELARLRGTPAGAAPAGLSGLLECVQLRDRERAEREIRAAAAEGRSFGFECDMKRPDGAIRRMLWRGDAAGLGGRVFGICQDITERRRAEQDLERANEFSSALLNSLGEGIVACDADGRVVLHNDAVRELLGVGEEALPAERWTERHELFEADGVSPLPAGAVPLERALRGEVVRDARLVIAHGGRARSVVANGRPFFDATGRKLGAVVAYQDVTERRIEEGRRQEAEERFRALFEDAPIAMAVVAFDGCVLQPNDALCRLLGFAAADLAGVEVWRLIDGVDVPGLLEELRPVLAGERESLELELRCRRADGDLLWAWLHVSALSDSAGSPHHMIAQFVDVTERRRIEQALRNAEERFRQVFEEGPVGMALVGEDLTLLQVNEALSALVGSHPDELRGSHLSELIHPEDAERHRALAGRMFSGEVPGMRVEQRLLKREGGVAWVALTATVLRDEHGEPLHGLAIIEDITERKRFEGQLRYFADHDHLTGLLNRRRFAQELERHVGLAARYGSGGAVLLMDLDNLKDVNDTLGHRAGDALIRDVAAVMRSRLRATDELARIGGDEFAVLLPHADAEEAREVAESLRQAVGEHETVVDGRRITVTASVGVAPIEAGEDAEQPLVEADVAMYAAKNSGRDRVAAFLRGRGVEEEVPPPQRAERLRRALEGDGFVLYGQPIACVETGSVSRYELLLRLLGDDGELIPPARFLSVAERFGLVEAIDEWVVSQAIGVLAERPGLDLDVNLSGGSLRSGRLLDSAARHLRERGVDPRRLTFELAESAALADIAHARQFATSARGMGCSMALDDFGAGAASASYLKEIPLDYLKIDGGFIQRLPDSAMDQSLVRSIVDVARGLGQRTIAEFVASRQALDAVRSLGVDYAQGDALSEPLPLSEVLAGHSG